MGNLKDLTQRLKHLDSETKPLAIQARQSELQLKLLVAPAGGDTTVSITEGHVAADPVLDLPRHSLQGQSHTGSHFYARAARKQGK